MKKDLRQRAITIGQAQLIVKGTSKNALFPR